ncbi:hypothetical protein B0I35DRAFT_414999 [Stachybotrys elegans]|uniref:Uncharacterized protein n=1 Tax=Stachybotrys elegans TaxID=80388 RepID=A0A8K0SGW3_9HYPO|nr:hypothetical protein B0I35DRAFT_414999 [Stachybotrys elegans]
MSFATSKCPLSEVKPATVASKIVITVTQLRSWNSEINASCSNLWVDYICVCVPGAVPTSTTSVPQPSNSPALPSAVNNRNRWSRIVSGESCNIVAAKNTIAVAEQGEGRRIGRHSKPKKCNCKKFQCIAVSRYRYFRDKGNLGASQTCKRWRW